MPWKRPLFSPFVFFPLGVSCKVILQQTSYLCTGIALLEFVVIVTLQLYLVVKRLQFLPNLRCVELCQKSCRRKEDVVEAEVKPVLVRADYSNYREALLDMEQMCRTNTCN